MFYNLPYLHLGTIPAVRTSATRNERNSSRQDRTKYKPYSPVPNGSGANAKGARETNVLPTNLTVRTSKYLNNVIEQDHRRVKQRVRPMLGFKRFNHAAITISGIELVHQIKKKQVNLSAVCASYAGTPQVWEAVLAA